MIRALTTTRRHRLRAFLADERGSVLPIVGLCMLVILGVAALTIDLGYQQALRSQLDATADAAALAAAAQLPDAKKAMAAAATYAEFNMPKAEHGNVLRPDDIEFGHWDADSRKFAAGGKGSNAVRVTIRRTADNGNPAQTFFLHLFGMGQADLVAQSLAGLSLSTPALDKDPAQWTAAERERVQEIALAVEEENKRRMWDKKRRVYDVRKAMTPTETEAFLLQNFGRPVLLH
jgi:Putative Tad-like Flp pilus-assembly